MSSIPPSYIRLIRLTRLMSGARVRAPGPARWYSSALSISLISLIGLIGLIGGAKTAHAATLTLPPNNTGLVGYWPMNEGSGDKAYDRSGNGNTGTLTNMEAADWVDGKFGRALDFDGSTEYVDAGTNISLNPSGSFTLSAWVKPSSLADFRTVIVQGSGGGYNSGYRMLIATTGTLQCQTGDSNVSTQASVGVLTPGVWTHVSCVWDGSNKAWYINGVLDSTAPATYNQDGNRHAYIGRSAWASNYPFLGPIDDVRVYNRALGADEIARMYQAGSAKRSSMNTTGLVGWWRFNEGSGAMVSDVGSGRNNGTWNGTGSHWTTGKSGTGGSFNGSDDYVDMSTSLSFGALPLTISFWTFPLDNSNQSYFSSQNSGVYGYYFATYGASLYVGYYDGGWTHALQGKAAFAINQWSHVVLTIDSTNGTRLYVNGVLRDSNSSPPIVSNYTNWKLGHQFNWNRFNNGSIDDVRIYNRALSADEISKIYNDTSASRITKVSTSPVTALADGLVGYWTFDGPDLNTTTSTDRSGQGNDGTLNGGPTPTSGIFGQALRFDGGDDYVIATTTLPSTFSVSAWVKNNGDTGDIPLISMGAAQQGTPTIYLQYWTPSDPIIYMSGTSYKYFSNSSLVDGDWHHIVAIVPGSAGSDAANFAMYVDGVALSAGASSASGDQTTKVNVMIGRNRSDGTYFNGSIDEVRIYNRVLSASEVLQLYNLGL